MGPKLVTTFKSHYNPHLLLINLILLHWNSIEIFWSACYAESSDSWVILLTTVEPPDHCLSFKYCFPLVAVFVLWDGWWVTWRTLVVLLSTEIDINLATICRVTTPSPGQQPILIILSHFSMTASTLVCSNQNLGEENISLQIEIWPSWAGKLFHFCCL